MSRATAAAAASTKAATATFLLSLAKASSRLSAPEINCTHCGPLGQLWQQLHCHTNRNRREPKFSWAWQRAVQQLAVLLIKMAFRGVTAVKAEESCVCYVGCWMLDVGCWRLYVECDRPPAYPYWVVGLCHICVQWLIHLCD